ncbi:unnamed protein product [Calicophoron daubneyi]|uniref:RRM domain-containing protein n=1 Tax=Calicophoron daubneyi TaxID=300641 RepID=A0AAV2TZM2_CALDB
MMNSDTQEGRTLFIRNLSFDVNDAQLEDFFVKFGPLLFAKVVKDPTTRHPRGSGFVKFVSPDDAARVLRESLLPENVLRFTLDNRILSVTKAISREEAAGLQKSHTEVSKEKNPGERMSVCEALHQRGRNLHLARIGTIRPGTPAAVGMPKEDLAKREKLLHAKKAKIKNHNIFISDVRLCIRNLPVNVSDADLRAVCVKAANRKNCRIKECRIMRNLRPGRLQFRSLGYGFVCFERHADALKVLNALNNNPDVFESHRRPIVEFSMENIQALEKKRCQAERSKVTQTEQRKGAKGENTALERKTTSSGHTSLRQRKVQSHIKCRHLEGTRILQKHFGTKLRHGDLGEVNEARSKKQKGRLSGRDVRLRRKQQLP